MVDQTAVTILAGVRPDDHETLRAQLEAIGGNAAGNAAIPFGRFDQLHFARLVLLDPVVDLDGTSIAGKLVFFADIDGPAAPFLRQLVDTAGDGLDTVLRYCDGYTTGSNGAEKLAYLEAHMIKAGAEYVNTAGRTARQVTQEAVLREAIEAYLDADRPSFDGLGAQQATARIHDHVAADPALSWALKPADGPGVMGRLRDWAALARLAAVMLLLSPLLILAAPFGLVLLRIHELRDPAPDIRPSPEHARDLADREDIVVQNPFMGVGFVKPGRFRRYLSTFALAVAGPIIRHWYDRTSLAGVQTIHFARWTFLDDRRRLLFGSNYDGSLESYMDDFIDRLAWGLNVIFGNGYGYPKVRWALFGGAQREESFKHFLRLHQVPCQVWYSAYPQLSAVNVANNAAIRAGLSHKLDDAAAAAWLRRL